MTVEITSTFILQGVVTITAIDVSEENLQRMERYRDDGEDQEIIFIFDTRKDKDFQSLRKWLKNQKATKNSSTYGEALHATIGTITDIPRRYRSWE